METRVKYNASPSLIESFKKAKKTSNVQKSLSKVEQELKPILTKSVIVPKPKKLNQVKLMGVTVGGKAQPQVEVVNKKHDDHYRNLESKGIEPILMMEQIIEANDQMPLKARLNVVMAIKHESRAGVKAGEDWKKELQKAINYLNRAITGQWVE